MQIEDPYSYRHQLTLPKYLILASGDPFSMPDTTKTYLQGLVGPTYLRLIPNCGHKIDSKEYYPSLFTFFKLVSTNKPIPTLRWKWWSEIKCLSFNSVAKSHAVGYRKQKI